MCVCICVTGLYVVQQRCKTQFWKKSDMWLGKLNINYRQASQLLHKELRVQPNKKVKEGLGEGVEAGSPKSESERKKEEG